MSLFLNHKKKIVENFYLDSLKARMIVPISKWWHRHTHCQLAHYLVAAVVVFFNSCHYIIMKGIVSIPEIRVVWNFWEFIQLGGQCLREGRSRQNILKIFWKYFENIFKTNEKVGVTRQQTWLRNEKIAEYFGENLDILTDLLWIFNNSKVFKIYFQNISAGSPFFQTLGLPIFLNIAELLGHINSRITWYIFLPFFIFKIYTRIWYFNVLFQLCTQMSKNREKITHVKINMIARFFHICCPKSKSSIR